jgi:hypothetical protein
MEIDMSPKAITARLKVLDQLWEMSIKLMKASKAPRKRLALPERLEERSFAARPEWRNDPQKQS